MQRPAVARRGIAELVHLRIGDEFPDRVRRRGVGHDHHQRVKADQCDRYEVGDRVVTERGIEVAIGRMRECSDIDGVAVGVGTGNEFGCNVAAGARLVLDDDLLTPKLGKTGRDDTGSRVNSSTGRERADYTHQLSGPSFRVSSEWPCDRCDRNPGDEIAPSHAVLPQPQTAPIATCSIPHPPRRRLDTATRKASYGGCVEGPAATARDRVRAAVRGRVEVTGRVRPQRIGKPITRVRDPFAEQPEPRFRARSAKRKPSAGGSILAEGFLNSRALGDS